MAKRQKMSVYIADWEDVAHKYTWDGRTKGAFQNMDIPYRIRAGTEVIVNIHIAIVGK